MPIIKLEKDGPIARLTFTRPDIMNALGAPGDGDAIAAACAEINADPVLRCAILTGEGKCFSAGGDVKAMRDGTGNFAGGGAQIREGYRSNIHKAARALFSLDVPLIAAVNGPAIGLGCDVACMADIRLSSDKARYGVTFLKLGLVPGDGGTWLLPRTIGMSRAAELFFTGDTIDAETAREWGLVSRVVPHDTLLDEATAMATKIAAMPPQALRMTKAMLRQGTNMTYDGALEMAAAMQAINHLTADHKEGVAALLDKRVPQFRGE